MTAARLRTFVLGGWMVSLLLVLAAYISAFSVPLVRPSLQSLLASAAIVIGTIAPHISLIVDAILDHQPYAQSAVERSDGWALMVMCLMYWITLVALVWAGIHFRAFPTGNGAGGLEQATSLIAACAGALSFLAIRPTVRLFRKSAG